VQTERHRHTRPFRGHGKTHGYTAVILFANLAAILSSHPDRLAPLFRKPDVIYYPCHHWVTAQHRGNDEIQAPIQDRFIIPWSIGNHMMQRLMHSSHILGSESGGHRFDALAFTRQQQSGAVILQGVVPIGMPCGFCQSFDICRKALRPWAWHSLLTHETIRHQFVIF
jgi:hypothetical protein